MFWNPEGQGKDMFAKFLSDPQSQNSYSYARNNPINLSDPSGLFSIFGTEKNEIAVGNWVSRVSSRNGVFDYVVSHKWVAYTLGGVGLVAGAGAAVLFGGAALGITSLAELGSTCIFYCDKVQKVIDPVVNLTGDGAEKAIEGYDKYSKYWTSTNFDSLEESVTNHLNKHGMVMTLESLTTNAQTVWSKYLSGAGDVAEVTSKVLKNGASGIKIILNNNAGGIFTETGSIVSTWFGK